MIKALALFTSGFLFGFFIMAFQKNDYIIAAIVLAVALILFFCGFAIQE